MKTILALTIVASTLAAQAEFKVTDQNGRIEVRDNDTLVFGWQHQQLKNAKGGEKFAGSAYIHPLTTPSGFELTCIQPGDHLHHYGVWWPWKLLTVKEQKYVTWEMQKGEGRHIGVSATVKSQSADEVILEAVNRTEIKPADADYLPVTEEHATLRFSRLGNDAYVVDITITDKPVEGTAVEVTQYRYSGFSWRGPADWNKDTSTMRTSGGHHRDNANGQEANWVSVDGTAKSGKATMLMMSAASKNDGPAERLRVWNSGMHHGAPFININPVMKSSIPLVANRKEVTQRRYRLIVADRLIPAAEANKLWQAWK